MIFKNKVIANGTKTTHLGMKKNCVGTKPDNFIPYLFIFISNRYENHAQGIKTAHLGMK